MSVKTITNYWKISAWALLVALLSLMPGDDMPDKNWLGIPGADKMAHAFFYFIFALLVSAKMSKNQIPKLNKTMPWPFVSAILYGGMMELLQDLTQSGRQPEWADIIANTLGAGAGVLFYPFLMKIRLIEKLIS
jgi:VanZ family protein